jgi:DNA-directed RNA polymerase subunit H
MVKKEVPVNEHFLVPEHRKLSAEEKQQIMEKYNATEKEFPKISIKDPAVRIFTPEVGDLIEIKRKVLDDKGEYLYYRIVS